MKVISVIVSILIFLQLSLQTSLSLYESMSIALFVYAIINFIEDLSKKLIVLDIIILNAIFSCLIIPIAGYQVIVES